MPKCTSCQAEIEWVKMASGKSMPCDPKLITVITEGGLTIQGRVSHFSTCPNANQHRKPKT